MQAWIDADWEFTQRLARIINHLERGLAGFLVEGIIHNRSGWWILTDKPPAALAEPAAAALLHLPPHDGIRFIEMCPGLQGRRSDLPQRRHIQDPQTPAVGCR